MAEKVVSCSFNETLLKITLTIYLNIFIQTEHVFSLNSVPNTILQSSVIHSTLENEFIFSSSQQGIISATQNLSDIYISTSVHSIKSSIFNSSSRVESVRTIHSAEPTSFRTVIPISILSSPHSSLDLKSSHISSVQELNNATSLYSTESVLPTSLKSIFPVSDLTSMESVPTSILPPSCLTTTLVLCSSYTPTSDIYYTSTILKPSMIFNYSSLSDNTTMLNSIPTMLLSSTNIKSQSSSFHSSEISETSIKAESISSAASIHYSSSTIINPPIELCDKVIITFSEIVINFTQCVLLNTLGMSVCQNCITPYDALQDFHKQVFKFCGNYLIGRFDENYQIIPKIFDAQRKTWSDLGCEKCIDRSSGQSKLSEKFQQFLYLYHETMDCFRNNTFQLHHNLTLGCCTQPCNVTADNPICKNCLSYYKDLQGEYKYYLDSEEETATPWCADINIAVNETRKLWRSCCATNTQKDLGSIIALTCFFCFLPIVFYVGTKLHSEVKERKTNHYYESD